MCAQQHYCSGNSAAVAKRCTGAFTGLLTKKNVAGVYIGEASVNSTHQGNFYIRKIFLVAIRASTKSRVYFVCLFVESVGWRRMAEEEFFGDVCFMFCLAVSMCAWPPEK